MFLGLLTILWQITLKDCILKNTGNCHFLKRSWATRNYVKLCLIDKNILLRKHVRCTICIRPLLAVFLTFAYKDI